MANKSKDLWDCNAARMWRHWRVLCEDIGERRAGTQGERAAADYLLEQFRRLGLQSVHAEPFPCTSLRSSRVELKLQVQGRLRAVPARALVGAAPTPNGREVAGELVWVEMPEQAERLFQHAVQGKILALFGPLPTDVGLHQKMVAAGPAAVIHVDDRLPFEWLKDDGVYPLWARRYGMPPTVSIPYRKAWDLKKLGAKRARLRVRLQQQESTSQNVVAEIPGQRPELPLVLVSAHHDTQCHNTGASDNASGVVAVLELAALLRRRRPLRTIRFVSFGTEEQLSVGSASYVAAHRSELSRIGAVLNMDGLSSVLGHFFLFRAGSPEFGRSLQNVLAEHGLDVAEHPEISPFGDHFPFSVFGIPAMTLSRPNMISFMCWQHHSAHDNLEEVSVPETAKAVSAMAGLIGALSQQAQWPFRRGLPAEQRAQTLQYARDLYGMRV